MNQELKTHESTIKRKPSYGWTPKYEEAFRTQLSKTVFFAITKDTIESLEWDLVFEDETFLEARRPAHGFHWGQKISISYDNQFQSIVYYYMDADDNLISFGHKLIRMRKS